MKSYGTILSKLGVMCCLIAALQNASAEAPTLVDLDKPAQQSIPDITGIYWTFEDLGSETQVSDSSSNNYAGKLEAGNGSLATLTPGPNEAYGKALRLETSATLPGASGNPRVYVIPGSSSNKLAMADTDFSGGAWIQFNSVLNGAAQTIVIMDRGGLNSTAGLNKGHYGFFLEKNAANKWRMAFQVGNGDTNATLYSGPFEDWNLQDGGWNHVGFSFDYGEGSAPNVIVFWLNGNKAGTAETTISITSEESARTRRLSVGDRTTGNYLSVFDGSIDDLFLTTGVVEFQAPKK